MTDTRTAQELHQRIAEYRHLRRLTLDKEALDAIDRIIAEAEDSLRRLSRDQA